MQNVIIGTPKRDFLVYQNPKKIVGIIKSRNDFEMKIFRYFRVLVNPKITFGVPIITFCMNTPPSTGDTI